MKFHIQPNWYKVQYQPEFLAHTSEGSWRKQGGDQHRQLFRKSPFGTVLGGQEEYLLPSDRTAEKPVVSKEDSNAYTFNGAKWNKVQKVQEREDTMDTDQDAQYTWNDTQWV